MTLEELLKYKEEVNRPVREEPDEGLALQAARELTGSFTGACELLELLMEIKIYQNDSLDVKFK